MNKDLNVYKTRKLIYELIFNFEKIDFTEDPEIFDLIILESLRNIVEYHVSNNELHPSVINNINDFLIQARFYEDDYKKKRINVINEIISLMNTQTFDENLIFYRLQLFDRRKDYKYLFKYTNAQILSQIDSVHDSICHDLYVITSHTNDFTDEEFIKEALPYLQDSNLYYESLNMILKENPALFKDKTFYNRMMCVLNINNEIYKDDEVMYRYNKKLVKRINKKAKRI